MVIGSESVGGGNAVVQMEVTIQSADEMEQTFEGRYNGLASDNINFHIIEGINNDDEEEDIQKDYHHEINPLMNITKDIINGIFQSYG